MSDRYSFGAGLGVAIAGSGSTLKHFRREYGAAAIFPTSPAIVEVLFTEGPPDQPAESSAGRYKGMRWRTWFTAPDAEVMRARIEVGGRPRSFARLLVQGYFVEPLISVAAVRLGEVLLPAAAFRGPTGATVILGQSGSGKTMLAMQGLACGIPFYGDDQVFIDGDGACRAFPRRMRLYSDLRERVPLAYRRLPRVVRAQLDARRLVRILSRGSLAPALPVPSSVFGQKAPPDPAPIRRVVILERRASATEVGSEPASSADAVNLARRLLREQRQQLLLAAGTVWRDALGEIERTEATLIAVAFAGTQVERVIVPSPIAGSAMTRLGEAVGFEPQS